MTYRNRDYGHPATGDLHRLLDGTSAVNAALGQPVGQELLGRVRGLLKAGANPNAVNDKGMTMLHVALNVPHSHRVVQALLLAGADPNRTFKDTAHHGPQAPLLAPLTLAMRSKYERQEEADVVRFLVEAGAEVPSALWLESMSKRHLETARALWTATRDTEATTVDGQPAWMVLARAEDENDKKPSEEQQDMRSYVAFLVDIGAAVNRVNTTGWTPLLVAARLDSFVTFTELIRLGADEKAATGTGKTLAAVAIGRCRAWWEAQETRRVLAGMLEEVVTEREERKVRPRI